jgi:hypothetical protein
VPLRAEKRIEIRRNHLIAGSVSSLSAVEKKYRIGFVGR